MPDEWSVGSFICLSLHMGKMALSVLCVCMCTFALCGYPGIRWFSLVASNWWSLYLFFKKILIFISPQSHGLALLFIYNVGIRFLIFLCYSDCIRLLCPLVAATCFKWKASDQNHQEY